MRVKHVSLVYFQEGAIWKTSYKFTWPLFEELTKFLSLGIEGGAPQEHTLPYCKRRHARENKWS